MYQAFGTKKMGRNLTATPHLKATRKANYFSGQ